MISGTVVGCWKPEIHMRKAEKTSGVV